MNSDTQLRDAIKKSVEITKLRRRLNHRYDPKCKCNLCVAEKQVKLTYANEARR